MLDRISIKGYFEIVNKLSRDKRTLIAKCLADGMGIRATVRVTGVSKNTVGRFLSELGEVCRDYQNKHLVNLPCKRIQCDEIWSFVRSKAANTPKKLIKKGVAGDVWTWVAICADTKLVPCWYVGSREASAARMFMLDLASRMSGRIQLTTDGHYSYPESVEKAFGCDIDYAVLMKDFAVKRDPDKVRYSPPACNGIKKIVVAGKPDPKFISTSFVERQNLTMRMSMKRFTRLTTAFSRKVERHKAAVALHFMVYNFVKIHETLSVTPAMEARVTDHLWEVEDIVALLEKKEAKELAEKKKARELSGSKIEKKGKKMQAVRGAKCRSMQPVRGEYLPSKKKGSN